MKILLLRVILLFSTCTLICQGDGLIGGYISHNLNDANAADKESYLQALKIGLNYMNQIKTKNGTNNKKPLKLLKLISVRTQVVAGVNYDLKFLVDDDGRKRTCSIIVSRLYTWLENGGETIVSSKSTGNECSRYLPSRQRRSPALLGGKKPLDKNDQQLLQAVQWAVEHINVMSNSMYHKALVEIYNPTVQVVNGHLYEFTVTVATTNCQKKKENMKKTLMECPRNNEYLLKDQECDVAVLFTEGKFQLKDVNCKTASKAPIIGGGDHDYKPHGMIGGGDHDYRPHSMFGGGDHDYKPHGMIGGGDHDYKPHGMIGGVDHDYKPHGMIGGGDHDYKPHGDSKASDEQVLNNLRDAIMNFGNGMGQRDGVNVHQMTIIDSNASVSDFCSQYKMAFEKFKFTYNKLYSSDAEESQRFQVFCKNMERVKFIQSAEQGSAQYGATIFADISEEEFKKQYLGLKPTKSNTQWPMAKIPTDPVPDSWDWRDHGAVTPVKNQGSCGSCWAFSTTGNIEGQWAINSASKKLLSLSEQELVDCDKLDQGCGGGYMYQAYEAVMNMGGLETEDDYKYEGKDDNCRFNSSEVVVKLTGAVNISQDETEMAAWLYKNGPISIGINAFAMQFYMGGISHPWKLFCSPDGLDHGVLIVGFGKKGNEPYWIVKNSWGPRWGVQGYYLVYRGDGTCGVNKMCSSATVN